MHLLPLDRRSLVKHLALACGLVLSTSSINSLASVLLKPTDLSRRKAGLLNAEQLVILREAAEVIIPTTETPGAIAAGVPDFINQFALSCLNSKEQNSLLQGLEKIGMQATANYQQNFDKLTLTQKTELLIKMEQAQASVSQQASVNQQASFNQQTPINQQAPSDQNDRATIKLIKSLVTFAYYTSEIGANQELAYLTIPGGYKGNFKFKDVGKAWALSQ